MAQPKDMGTFNLDTGRGLISYFSQNHVAANVLMLLVFLGGLISISFLTFETFPKYDPRAISVKVPYLGATPAEVEEDIVRRVEESLTGIVGIERTVSNSEEGLGTVIAELSSFADDVDVLNYVRTAVERIEDFPPANADQPEIKKVEVNRSVMTVAVTSSSLDQYSSLRRFAERIRDEMLLLPSVSIIDLFGTRDQEIQIEISEETLRRYGLSMDKVVAAIRAASVNLTGGELRTESGDIVMSTLAKRETGEEFEDIVIISRPDGTIVRLKDVATIRDSLVERDAYTAINGKPTVFLQIKVASGITPQKIVEEVRQYLAETPISSDISIAIWEDETSIVEDRLFLIAKNAVMGCVLVFLTLLLFFDLRVAIWVTAGIPVSFVGSLIFFPAFDLSVNVITLFAFFILIGVVVDDAIVVGESIVKQRDDGLEGASAAIAGTKAVLGPITIGAATTMVAFLILWPLDGVLGQMFSPISIVVILVLLISLFEAIIVLPGHLSIATPWSKWPLAQLQEHIRVNFQNFLTAKIVPLISWSARRPLVPPVIVSIAVIIAVLLVLTSIVNFNPSLNLMDENNLQVDLEMPVNAQFAEVQATTDYIVRAAEQANQKAGGSAVNAVAVVIGQHKVLEDYQGIRDSRYAGHLASVQLRLNSPPIRTVTVKHLRHMWREALGTVPGGVSITYPTRQQQPSMSLSYALIHPDAKVLEEATTELRNVLIGLDGIYDVRDSMGMGKRRFDIVLNKTGYAAGLNAASVASQLRNTFHGTEAQRIQRGREEVLVMVRYPSDRRGSYADLLNERIYRPDGSQVPLSTIADITESQSFVNQLRIDGRNASTITAYLDLAALSSEAIRKEVERNILPDILDLYPGLQVQKHGMTRDVERIYSKLFWIIPIVVLVIYCLVASLLRSFIQPLLALAGIPMAFVGSVIGHLILGYEFSNTSLFGLVAVSGVVVNDTILLLNQYNQIRRERVDVPAIAAISAAAQMRARAILLTSFTTVIGLLPLLFDKSEIIQFLLPLVVSLAFGVIFAGIGLLFFLPSVLMVVELIRSRLGGRESTA